MLPQPQPGNGFRHSQRVSQFLARQRTLDLRREFVVARFLDNHAVPDKWLYPGHLDISPETQRKIDEAAARQPGGR